jgi:lipopolysaccharide export system protein LptA
MKQISQILLLCGLCLGELQAAPQNEGAISVDADRVVVDEPGKLSTFSGRVVLRQGNMEILASRLVYRQLPGGAFALEAEGNPIRFQQEGETPEQQTSAFAEKLEYQSRLQQIRLMRRAVLRRAGDEVRGDSVTYHLGTRQFEVLGGEKTATEPGRVRIVIQPRSGNKP